VEATTGRRSAVGADAHYRVRVHRIGQRGTVIDAGPQRNCSNPVTTGYVQSITGTQCGVEVKGMFGIAVVGRSASRVALFVPP
jgi:hypothetical protein